MLATKRNVVLALVLGVCLGQSWISEAAVEGTQRKVQGIITAVDGNSVTICPMQGRASFTGRVDTRRTVIAVDGKPASLAALSGTERAGADLGLDDVWVSIRASSKH
jgi:hypothetical protein